MGFAIVAGFVALVVAEIYVIIAVANATSPWLTVLLLVGTSVLGGALVRREGARAWARAAKAMNEGRAPGPAIADGVLIFVGGVLLFIPGFITDAIGLLFVAPGTRLLFRRAAVFLLARRTGMRVVQRAARRGGWGPPGSTVIDGEVVDPRPDDPARGRSSIERRPDQDEDLES